MKKEGSWSTGLRKSFHWEWHGKMHEGVRARRKQKELKTWHLHLLQFFGVIKNNRLSLMQIHPCQSRLFYSCVRNMSSTYETNVLVFFLHLCISSKLSITMKMTQCCQILPECHLIYHKQFQINGYPIFPFLSIP